MKVEVAIGEVFDKITILDIKLKKIKDEEIVTATNKCFVTCNTILNDMNTMMIK